MKAALVRAVGSIADAAVAEIDEPTALPGAAIVEVVAAEANYPDMLVVEGRYQNRPPLPFVPGKTAAGRIVAVGDGVRDVAVGDRVLAHVEHGAYAQRLAVAAGVCCPIPDAMPYEVAAALGLAYQTAYFALVDRGGFMPGQSVLVLGATGGVGSAGVQLAKALGASTVVGGVRGARKAELALSLGCDATVDLGADGAAERLKDEVRALTRDIGADVILDPVGGEMTTAALRSLAWSGRLVILGFVAGIASVPMNRILLRNVSVAGLHWSDYRDGQPERVRAVQQAIFDMWSDGRLRPHISRRVPLDGFREALAAFRDGDVCGRIIIDVQQHG